MTSHQERVHPTPLCRRDFLRVGILGSAGLRLSELLRARALHAAQASPPPACILIFLAGGHSQLETYDLKPDAPDEYRGPCRPIPTCLSGFDVCEFMPRHAAIADRLALVRSCSHSFSGHWDGCQHVLTGWPAVLTGGGTPTSVYPEIGTIVKRLRPCGPHGLPNYVAVPSRLGAVGPAYLGKAYEPFEILGDPNLENFQVPNLSLPADALARLEERVHIRRAFDRLRSDLDHSGVMETLDHFDSEAIQLLTGTAAQQAFDLTRVHPRERDRYGRTRAGQLLLMARRLVEAGVGFVTAETSTYPEAGVEGGWDDHATAGDIFDKMKRRLPVFDQAFAALIEDLYDRGLDRQVLVVVMSEFGRTPRIDVKNGVPGRDHHPGVMSVVFSGGGLRMGQVIGSSDARAERPLDRPLRPVDVLATIYRFLGIDPAIQFRNHAGRPLAVLPEGEPIAELSS